MNALADWAKKVWTAEVTKSSTLEEIADHF